MRWPVSRERYDESLARIAELQEQNRKLTELLIPAMRAPSAVIPIDHNTDLSKMQPIPGKPTIANVIAYANAQAQKRAETPGAKSVTEELAEHASVWRKA